MKSINFAGRSLESLKAFPQNARREAGYQLDRVQHGLEPNDYKVMKSIGRGVREIRIHSDGEYRVIYIANIKSAIYVLHAFSKKSQKTLQRDLDVAKNALQEAINANL